MIGSDFRMGDVIEACVLVQRQHGNNLIRDTVFAGKYDPDCEAVLLTWNGSGLGVADGPIKMWVRSFDRVVGSIGPSEIRMSGKSLQLIKHM